ncbi:MAG TPA: dihydrofolate reductase [Chitinophagales bacterium]|nr:dihydrofolate reductase [Chitinophagales bacterium]
MKISMVVAASENNAIGLKGKLLWHLPKDMQFFKDVTEGHYVLMGRKSWEALPPKFRPLPKRPNVVITRQPGYEATGATVVPTIEAGVELARQNAEQELMVIGGGEIYKQALPVTNKVYLTRVHHVFDEADAYFPELNEGEWEITSTIKHTADEKHRYSFDFLVYERKKG